MNLTKEKKVNLDNIVNLRKINVNTEKQTNSALKSKIPSPFYTLTDETDNTLIFESRFESGNLLASYKLNESTYQLILQNDTNTHGYSQWFFFKVSNVKKGRTVHFNILNMLKSYSLFNKGMKISVYSEKKAEKEKIGWHKSGENIVYYKNGLFKWSKNNRRYMNSLSFTYEFEFDNDIVYFAKAIPYTYTRLNIELNEYQLKEKKYPFFYRKMLCNTLAGNSLDYVIITEAENENQQVFLRNINSHSAYSAGGGKNEGWGKNKQGVVIMARAHPGETPGSWMMKGIIDFLLGNSNEAKFLRNKYIFKIIPMLNPDGVICGNYRTSIAGCDLNRRWNKPNENIHPEIFFAKQMIMKFAGARDICLICDLHGHTGAHNVFIYGNNNKDDPVACRIFPFLISKITDVFNFKQCSFKMSKNKRGTAKINLFKEINKEFFSLPNVFTMEASFCGGSVVSLINFINIKGKYEGKHFSTQALMEIGRNIVLSIITYDDIIKGRKIVLKLDKGKLIEYNKERIQNELEAIIEEKRKMINSHTNVNVNNGIGNIY